MLKQHRAQPGRMDRAVPGGPPPRPAIDIEDERAAVTFRWWLYGNDRFIGHSTWRPCTASLASAPAWATTAWAWCSWPDSGTPYMFDP